MIERGYSAAEMVCRLGMATYGSHAWKINRVTCALVTMDFIISIGNDGDGGVA